MTQAVIFLIVSIGLLWIGADWIVECASAIARKHRVSELAIGLTVVAFGTSAPEFIVTFSAAFKGLPDISLSNVVGSNFLNLGLILGLMAMIRPLRTGRLVLYRDGMLLLGLTALVTIAAAMNALGRVTGVVLLAGLAGYIFYLATGRGTVADADLPESREVLWHDYPRLILGFVAVSLGGSFLVDSATFLARAAGVSEWFIGMTLVAFGTSLPELVTCLAAALKGRSDMLLGNLIGSNYFNFAGVLGATCLIRPLTVSPEALPALYVNLAFVALVLLFIRTNWRIGRIEGFLLMAVNLAQFSFGLAH